MTDVQDAVQEAATGDVSDDAPTAVEATAAALGWQKEPPEGWEGNWDDPDAYLAKIPAKLERLKSRAEKAEEKAKAAIRTSKTATAEAKKRIIADAEDRIKRATEEGDAEAGLAAARDLAKAEKSPPAEIQAFMVANPWFDTDRAATRLATAVSADLEADGASVAEQLEAAEAEVRRVYPHLFGEPEPAKQKKAPPALAQSARTPPLAPREKGLNDVPKDIRNAWTADYCELMETTPARLAAIYHRRMS